jgi:hypothetical protein
MQSSAIAPAARTARRFECGTQALPFAGRGCSNFGVNEMRINFATLLRNAARWIQMLLDVRLPLDSVAGIHKR